MFVAVGVFSILVHSKHVNSVFRFSINDCIVFSVQQSVCSIKVATAIFRQPSGLSRLQSCLVAVKNIFLKNRQMREHLVFLFAVVCELN